MKHDLTTGIWQDDTKCPISIILVTTSDAAPRMLEVGQEVEFYMVDNDPPSTRGGGGGGGGRLAASIVRPLPWGSVVFECTVAVDGLG